MATDPQTQPTQTNLPGMESVPVVSLKSAPKPMGCIVFEEQLEVPLGIASLEDFRKWAVSDEFPERWRIDYLAGRIEIEMSPENLFTDGTLKTEMATVMNLRVKKLRLGHLFIDRARISSPVADLSAEPDIVFVSKASIAEKRVVLIPYVDDPDQFIEFEGAPDLVVEIVSKSSVGKDAVRLPALYWQAGVREYWLADARKQSIQFQIHSRGETEFEPMIVDADGFQRSGVLGCAYRIERERDENGHWVYSLVERE